MSKKKNPLLFKVISYAFAVAVLILFYIGLLLETKNFNKKINNLEAALSAMRNRNTDLLVEKQILETEERIIPYATAYLLMKKNEEQVPVIEIDRNHEEQIIKIINGKYE